MSSIGSTLASSLLSIAVWQLPRAQQDRYRREFNAELFEIPPGQQLAYSIRILLRSWALRTALRDVEFDDALTPATPLRCRWHLHKWSLQRSPDGGGGYYECLGCARQKDYNASIIPPTMGGLT
jgi:hypothetical protein